MVATATEEYTISTDEAKTLKVDMRGLVDTDNSDTLTGTPTVQGDASFTISNEQVNSSSVVINDETVGIGLAVLFKVSCNTAGFYELEINCDTTGGDTVEGIVRIRVIATLF